MNFLRRNPISVVAADANQPNKNPGSCLPGFREILPEEAPIRSCAERER
jgi:hypothetical protein